MNAVAEIDHEQSTELDVAREQPVASFLPGTLSPMEMAFQLAGKGVDIGTIREMMAVSKELAADQARRAFDAAMSSAKGEIPPIIKNRVVDFTSAKGRTHYRHEDLGEIAKIVNPILKRHGLSYRFRTEQEGGQVKVTCIVAHREGHFEENSLSAGRDDSGNKNGIQQVGSTITYLQRYTLKAALGLAASNDDDGQAAGEETQDNGAITEEQLAELIDLIEAVEADSAKFAKFMKVDRLAELPARQFDRAVAELKKFGENRRQS